MDRAALIAKQNGRCMALRRCNIGWLLVASTTLAWIGCNQVQPHAPAVKAPQAAPPLQIGETADLQDPIPNAAWPTPTRTTQLPAPEPNNTGSHATLLPPLPEPLPPARMLPPETPHNKASAEPLRTFQRLAAERLAATPAYVARFKRRERVNGVDHLEESLVLKYRAAPFALALRWTDGEAKNRELVCVKGQSEYLIHLLPAPSDNGKLAAASRRTIVLQDSPQGLGNERYPVGETGFAGLIDRFGRLVDALERGDSNVGTVKYLGKVNRPEFEAKVDAVLHIVPPGFDKSLPDGGERFWFFDGALRFPVLVIAHNSLGQEEEYYLFDNILFPGVVRESDFNPASLGRH
jgi:Protein of unknown function (DUF1571)